MHLAPAVFGGAADTPRPPVSALFTLTPAESKRLIAKGVAVLPSVRQALRQGKVIVATGSTNGYVAEELLGRPFAKENFLSGVVPGGYYSSLPAASRLAPVVFIDGKLTAVQPATVLPDFTADDVFIKGANAIDRLGHVGILNADPTGGTIGQALPIINARGSRLIVPVGLEKMIPSVAEAARRLGIERLTHGLPGPGGEAKTGMVPLINADVVTEIVALRILAGVTATHVASGGVNGAEGSAGFVIEGSAPAVERALTLIKNIKGEPNLIIPGV